MTWESPEERDALEDNRERLWNRRTPLYESGELPMSEKWAFDCELQSICRDGKPVIGLYGYVVQAVQDLVKAGNNEAALAERDRQIAALTAERDGLHEAISKALPDLKSILPSWATCYCESCKAIQGLNKALAPQLPAASQKEGQDHP